MKVVRNGFMWRKRFGGKNVHRCVLNVPRNLCAEEQAFEIRWSRLEEILAYPRIGRISNRKGRGPSTFSHKKNFSIGHFRMNVFHAW